MGKALPIINRALAKRWGIIPVLLGGGWPLFSLQTIRVTAVVQTQRVARPGLCSSVVCRLVCSIWGAREKILVDLSLE